ncbi:tetratricopeptide repeat protein [Muricauda sp. 334s03]|uniref:Tetratricopeptide repeat protein n=1 Tax=Flagellimonas yonaguniensis TaxID=3031325 RepID=A0ABT5XTZ4_9FLAO|nr:tetratricopeptide repeat protein [[Muricauda] yonaguniensis]MDF0714652.1 tetratricopeptide repeat protein [[Muricauda] yonaguniensis]
MKKFFLLAILVFSILICSAQKDSISIQELTIIQLEDEINDLNRTLQNSNEHIKDLLIENEKLSNSNFDKVDNRLTNFIWLISVVGSLAITFLTFFGWKYLSNSISNFFTERAQELSDAKLNKIVTEKWIREQVEKKSEQPIKKAIEALQLDFVSISEQLINDEKSKWEKHHEIAKKSAEEIQKLKDSLGFEEKSDNVSKEKIKEAANTPKETKDFNWEDWYWQGRNQTEENDIKGAINSFLKALEKEPGNYLNYTWLGYLNILNEEYTQALKFLDIGIKLGAKHESVWNNRGYCYLNLKKFTNAIEDFNNALKINPNYANSYCHRSYANFQLGNNETALADANKAIELNSNYGNAHYNLGLIFAASNKNDMACLSWKKALKLGFEKAQEKLNEFCNSKD